MVKDRQVKRLWQALSSGKRLAQAADKADMDEKTGSGSRSGRLIDYPFDGGHSLDRQREWQATDARYRIRHRQERKKASPPQQGGRLTCSTTET